MFINILTKHITVRNGTMPVLLKTNGLMARYDVTPMDLKMLFFLRLKCDLVTECYKKARSVTMKKEKRREPA